MRRSTQGTVGGVVGVAVLMLAAAGGAVLPQDPDLVASRSEHALATDLLAIHAGVEDRDARLLAWTDAASHWQAHAAGSTWARPPAATPAFEAPSDAVAALARSLGLPDPDAFAVAAEGLDDLPPVQRVALAHLLGAFLAFHGAAADAFGAPAHGTRARADVRLDVEPLLAARFALLDAALAVDAAFPASAQGALPMPLVVPPLLAVDLAGGDTVHDTDVLLSIDVGGDDTYLNNVGGNGIDASLSGVGPNRAAALLDLAGDDRYLGTRYGKVGGGYRGAGFLLDLGGADRYYAASHGVMGGSAFGAGFLLDAGDGDDHYIAADFSGPQKGVNGGATDTGLGFLLDAGGSDRYQAFSGRQIGLSGDSRWGVNGGSHAQGIGFLFDVAGDDTYHAGREGVNGGAQGGVGFLLDAAGDDAYLAARVSWGGSLIPTGPAANGGAVLGRGFLWDVAGDDHYLAGGGAVNGGATGGLGLLLDSAGLDRYDDGATSCIDCSVVPKGTVGAQVDG